MSEDCCMSCGHIRYLDDPFNGDCEVCCAWILTQLSEARQWAASATTSLEEWKAKAKALAEENATLCTQLLALEGTVCCEDLRLTVLTNGATMKEISTEKLGRLFEERNALKAENTMLRDRYETELTKDETNLLLRSPRFGRVTATDWRIIDGALRDIRSRRPA